MEVMMIDRTQKDLILQICSHVLQGNMNLEELDKQWIKVPEESRFLSKVHEDLEEAIEHCPGHWRTRKILLDVWMATEEYFQVAVDVEIISRDLPDDLSVEMRERMLSVPKKQAHNIKQTLDQFMAGLTITAR